MARTNFLNRVSSAWNALRGSKEAPKAQERSYREVISVGGTNSDWSIGEGTLSQDSALWQNIFLMRSRSRDLFRTNFLFQAYQRLIVNNVFGDEGIMLTMGIQETEDRVVHAPDEKQALAAYERRINRVREWAAKKAGSEFFAYRAYKLADMMERSSEDDILRGTAKVQVGAPDVYANRLIQGHWDIWQRKEYSDMRKRFNYRQQRELRLISPCRDGGFFIQLVKDPRLMKRGNPYGFSLRGVNDEWCDHWYNVSQLPNGNEIRMGIEYQRDEVFGITEPVAYYFIKRQPGDWQFSVPGNFNFSSSVMHDRVPAKEIIYRVSNTDNDATRGVPWGASIIGKARTLDQTELAHLTATRAAACKMGWFVSGLVPEGGQDAVSPDKMGLAARNLEPGAMEALPYGVDVKTFDPNFPNANFEGMRAGMIRSFCAGMPGASYPVIGADWASVNFSAGRLDRLTMTGDWKQLQAEDIDQAERPIFEAWLEMALICGAIPLPFAKYPKFNRPTFQGKRWEGVDPQKEVTANALEIANGFNSHTSVCAGLGRNFEAVSFQRAEDMMLLEELGLPTILTVETPPPAPPEVDEADDGEEKPKTKKPKSKEPAKDLVLNGNRHDS